VTANNPPTIPRARVARPVRVTAALLTLIIALGIWGGTRTLTDYQQRGVVTAMPAADAPLVPGNGVGVQVFLDKEADFANVRRTAEMLKDGGVTWVRESFSWCDIERTRGQYWDSDINAPTWQKYDRIINVLADNGIKVMARLDNAPTWSRPGKENGAGNCQKGPPTDLNTYADFVRAFTDHYRGKIAAVQIWNEPNLAEEWVGEPLNVVRYSDMLRRAYAAAKQGDPNVIVVTAAMAPTAETDPAVGMSDLIYYEQMYQAGAKGAFDVLAVNVYGLGEPPDDRRIAASRFNVSRPILVHDIMERYGDTGTPVWTTEFGYNSLPKGWTGEPSIWGQNVDEATQARYIAGGLTRMTQEWPWMGTVFIWGFRWAERPGTFGKDPTNPTGPAKPEPYFALVNYDFTPRPAWLAVKQFAHNQSLRPGRTAATDSVIQAGPGWERIGTGTGTETMLTASAPDASLTIPFTGTDLAVVGSGGAVRVSVDGHDRGTIRLPQAPNIAALLAGYLPDGAHTAILHPADGTVHVGSFLVQRRDDFGWVLTLLTFGVVLIGAGSVGWVVAEMIGACDALLARHQRTTPRRVPAR
jgi:hypothetical protein